jgi:alkylated DNA repair protein (DNA oxidative demethylase)
MLTPDLFERESITVAPGAFFIPDWLSLDEQIELVKLCRQWAKASGGFTIPRMPDGTPMLIKSICLGHDWRQYTYPKSYNSKEYKVVKALPPELAKLAGKAFGLTFGADGAFSPDSAILNWYDENSTLGMHQDRGESEEVIDKGSPVISISIGDTAVFRFGNTTTRTRPYQDVMLRSGDLFVFGGQSRRAYHSITRIFPRTSPPALESFHGRLNVTIRESGFG